MSDEIELQKILEKHKYYTKRGAFYGGVGARPLGSGMIIDNCRIPYFNADKSEFLTGRGTACVLTHECDIEPDNERPFNDKLLVVPIIDFKIWFEHAIEKFDRDTANRIALDIVADQIFRVFFLPSIPNTNMDYGGFVYLNEVTNVDVLDVVEKSRIICSLSDYSFRILSFKIENHLLRPKSSQLMPVH